MYIYATGRTKNVNRLPFLTINFSRVLYCLLIFYVVLSCLLYVVQLLPVLLGKVDTTRCTQYIKCIHIACTYIIYNSNLQYKCTVYYVSTYAVYTPFLMVCYNHLRTINNNKDDKV
jgi:hypothetical protein